VFTVRVEYEMPAGVGIVSNVKIHVAPAGRPDEQANDTLELKPASSCTVTVVVPLCPAWTEMDAGLMVRVKSAVSTTWLNAVDVLPVKFESPL
jgi:hypothetical protein